MNHNADTISVRSEEQFDEQKLADFLKDKLEGSDKPLTVRQFPGGKANLTYHLDYGSHEYVLRRPPLGPVAPSAHDMGREFSVLSVLHKSFPFAPRAFLFSDNSDIVGAPFFIMERHTGVVVRTKVPSIYDDIPDAGQQMSTALADALAKLHKVDYKSLGLESLGKPEGFIERQVAGWYKRWEAAKHTDIPEMDEIHKWLNDNMPSSGPAVLVHNDYKLDNVMLASDNPGKIEAIFDWDMCTLGDPLADLGALLCYWVDPDDPPFFKQSAMMPMDNTFLTRKELVERYAETSGRDVSEITFYHILGLFRLVGIAAQIYIRFLKGQTQDKRFAIFGDMIPALTQFAVGIIRAH
ncbi:MAG: phosphotransferase family protein [Candidatus Marinimicrobia bacterium]|jgi:aminoglycoside phosphotransferase (APT) family kinase protein|nr:phosphotransferase family protein [Candidatus Neomarinimicrobiota bacterium]MBT5175812.1 phosphotransferase family protein [Candidatus Neomarinimicrobiota bacterium]